VPWASRVATAPQSRFARITSIRLEAENRPALVTIQISSGRRWHGGQIAPPDAHATPAY
jgi:hypothetical protein